MTANDLLDAAELLFRPTAKVELAGAGAAAEREAPREEFVVLPDARRPRLLVPASSRQAAAAALRHRGDHLGVRDRAVRTALRVGLRTGAAQRVLTDRLRLAEDPSAPDGAESVLGVVRSVFGADALVGIGVGPVRVNQKPVLQVLSPSGQTLGFVKVGWNPLTRSLVSHEAAVLQRFDGHPAHHVVAPRVVAVTTAGDLELLALTPLPRGGGRRTRPRPPLAAMRSLAASAGTSWSRLADLPAWQELGSWDRERSNDPRLPPPGELTGPTLDGVDNVEVQQGASHGDWTPWNYSRGRGAATGRDDVNLWDWERFSTGVPVGVDLVHWCVQRHLGRGRPAAQAVAVGSAEATELLPRLGVARAASTAVSRTWAALLVRRFADDPANTVLDVLVDLLRRRD